PRAARLHFGLLAMPPVDLCRVGGRDAPVWAGNVLTRFGAAIALHRMRRAQGLRDGMGARRIQLAEPNESIVKLDAPLLVTIYAERKRCLMTATSGEWLGCSNTAVIACTDA